MACKFVHQHKNRHNGARGPYAEVWIVHTSAYMTPWCAESMSLRDFAGIVLYTYETCRGTRSVLKLVECFNQAGVPLRLSPRDNTSLVLLTVITCVFAFLLLWCACSRDLLFWWFLNLVSLSL